MTSREYWSLKTGDTVYSVNFRFLKATIDREEVDVSYYIPGRKDSRWVCFAGKHRGIFEAEQFCFLTLDEASDYLRKALDERKTKPLKVGFRTYPNTAVMVREA